MATKQYADYLRESTSLKNHPYMAPPTMQAPYRVGLTEPIREYKPAKYLYTRDTPREASSKHFNNYPNTSISTLRNIRQDIESV